MNKNIKLQVFIIVALALHFVSSSNNNNNNDYDEEIATEAASSHSKKLTSTLTTSPTQSASEDYYDDEDYANQAQSNEETNWTDDTPPYTCPSQCKCIFNKQTTRVDLPLGHNTINSDYYDAEKRAKRFVLSSSNSSDYDYEETNHPSDDHVIKKPKVKFDITVDCSAHELSSISSLFDYDFPLEQIVHL